MPSDVRTLIPDRHAEGRARQARIFLLIATLEVGTGGGLSLLLIRCFGLPQPTVRLTFPPALAVSTALLLGGSLALHRAAVWVRRERQLAFRLWLCSALLLGTSFIGVQIYGLLAVIPRERSSEEASLGIKPFILAFATLHVLHFFVATLFVAFVAARTIADRYDHEYHWGVTLCAWFWHLLGLAWLAILAIFAIAL